MPPQILSFLHKMRLLSLAVQDENGVYIANAFYAFDEVNLSLIIASHESSKHIKLALENNNVALNIAKDSKIALLQGLQIKALLSEANEAQERMYHAKFPFAKLSKFAQNKPNFYALKLLYIKMTDNKALKIKLEWSYI